MPEGQQTVTLTLTLDKLNVVLESLGAQPFVRVADTINDLRMQATVQLAKNQQPKPEGEEK